MASVRAMESTLLRMARSLQDNGRRVSKMEVERLSGMEL